MAAMPAERAQSVARVDAFAGREKMGGTAKDALGRSLAEHLDYPYDELVQLRIFSLMSGEDLRRIVDGGATVALHTHRHEILDFYRRFPRGDRREPGRPQATGSGPGLGLLLSERGVVTGHVAHARAGKHLFGHDL